MKNNILIFSLLLMLTALFSCEKTEKLEDFPLYPPKLVLNSYLNSDSIISIHLSKSLSVLDNAELKNIDNANILLFEDGNQIATLNTSDGFGNYSMNYKPKEGSNYKVEASAPSLDNINATTMIPKAVSITNIEAKELNSGDWENSYKFSITFSDPPGEKNYYMFHAESYAIKIFVVGNDTTFYEDYNSSLWFSSSNNPAVNDVLYGNVFFKDDIFDGKTYTMDANIDYLYLYAYKVKIVFQLYSLSEADYMYRLSLNKYKDSNGNPFAEPVQVFNNIEGGYGVFGGEVIKTDSIMLDGKDYNW